MSSRDLTIMSVTPTICSCMGIESPGISESPAIPEVTELKDITLGTNPVERCLIFAPDAVGRMILDMLPELERRVSRLVPVSVPVSSVIPPKTPVCFASMFTGAEPLSHGITQYERPVLECDTMFDALLRSSKRVAVVAVQGSSMSVIFNNRDMDYFFEPYDPEVTQQTVEVLHGGEYDVIVAYHQAYDDQLHATTPFSREALSAVDSHVNDFEILSTAFHQAWQDRSRLLLFAPDHGAHIDPSTGHGNHGENIPDDMDLVHYYGIWR